MEASALIRSARTCAGLSLRDMAARAGTSHATIAAYEAGRVTPSVETLDRIVRACGFGIETSLSPRIGTGPEERAARGRELIEVLELAEMFPARMARRLDAPQFGAVA